MRQVAYPAALGSCMLGAGALPVRAAEWSITPAYGSSVDYDSNRRLTPAGKGSEATVLSVDLKFKRALEDLELTFEPQYILRRFTDASLGNGDDRTVNAAMTWKGERATGSVTASYLDQSTLVAELLETGFVSADTHRRLAQAGASWSWSQTERRTLVAQINYMYVSYYGRFASGLPGYRYPSASLGEQFGFSERGSVTVSVFGSRLQSDTEGNSSHEAGLQLEVLYLLSERTKIDATFGKSQRLLQGESSRGTDASFSLTRSLYLGSMSFSYKRNLVPYGFGFLAQQEQFTAAFTHPLTDTLDYTFSAFRVQNNETTVLLRLDRRNYNNLSAGLSWHPTQTWSVGAVIQGIRTQTVGLASQPVHQWRSSVTLTWSPYPKARSW
jgi:hypothetical protein